MRKVAIRSAEIGAAKIAAHAILDSHIDWQDKYNILFGKTFQSLVKIDKIPVYYKRSFEEDCRQFVQLIDKE